MAHYFIICVATTLYGYYFIFYVPLNSLLSKISPMRQHCVCCAQISETVLDLLKVFPLYFFLYFLLYFFLYYLLYFFLNYLLLSFYISSVLHLLSEFPLCLFLYFFCIYSCFSFIYLFRIS